MTKLERLPVYLSSQAKEALAKYAEAHGIAQSSVVKLAILAYIGVPK